MSLPFVVAVEECVDVKGGEFSVSVPGLVQADLVIRSAIVLLPEGETGTVDEIVITGPDGEREFSCEKIKVQNGTDLIRECGGPAILRAGLTTYEAKGSDFTPDPNTRFCIELDTVDAE